MSHAWGEVWSEDGKLYGFFEYDGTSDVVCTRIHLDRVGVEANWRKDNWRKCTCGSLGQPVILYTSYGFGFYWPGRVCWGCLAVTEGITDDGLETHDGHPFFNEWMINRFGKVMPCPSCGENKLESDGDQAPIRCSGCGKEWFEWNLEPKEKETT
jgi:hypothetical protein